MALADLRRSARYNVLPLLGVIICVSTTIARAEPIAVDFHAPTWVVKNGGITTHMDRVSFRGTGVLEGVEFANGVIEVDIAVTGARSYPGILFRLQSEGNYERLYVRPHRAGLYPDALQYAPAFNGVTGWQLYHGDGFTAPLEVPTNTWIPVRLEVKDSQARVFINGSPAPSLEMMELKHGVSQGQFGLMGPRNGTAYFSNLRYELTDDLEFAKRHDVDAPSGTLVEWEISKAYPTNHIDLSKYPRLYQSYFAGWQSVRAESSGVVNISKHLAAEGRGSQTVYARTSLYSETDQAVLLSLGYSDNVTVFFNGAAIYTGINGYRSRDPSYVGAIGYYDSIHLPFRKGINEIFLVLSDSFGGWGFKAKTDVSLSPPQLDSGYLTKAWQTPPVFSVPESVVFDPLREVFYVSNFDKVDTSRIDTGFISRLTIDGNITDLRWVDGLDGACGMALKDDRLFVLESIRGQLVEIDVDSGKIVARHKFTGHRFLNDIVTMNNNLYISNTSRKRPGVDIFEFAGSSTTAWKTGSDLHRTNGLFFYDGSIIAGNTGGAQLTRIDPSTRHATPIASLGGGTIDGIGVDGEGNFLVTHWEGKMFRVSPKGDVSVVLNDMHERDNLADFTIVENHKLVVIPTFLGNRVVAYRLSG